MKMKQGKMNMIVLLATAMGSMMVGMLIGCMKEKMKMQMDACCIVDEM